MIRRLKYFHDSHDIIVIQAPGCDFPFFSFLLNVPNFLKHLLNKIERRKLLSPFFDKPYQEIIFNIHLNNVRRCK